MRPRTTDGKNRMREDARKMTELTIRPEGIRDALARFVGATAGCRRDRGGRHRHRCGDSITPGSRACPRRCSCSSSRTVPAAWPTNLDIREIGVVILGDQQGRGGPARQTDRRVTLGAGRRCLPRRVVGPLGRRLTARARSGRPSGRAGAAGPSVVQRQPVKAAADRRQGDRRDDADRPRPAPADHRRPADRQDCDRDRQSSTSGRTGSRRPGADALHLCGDRPEPRSRRSASRWRTRARWRTRDVTAPASDPAGYKYIAPIPARRSASTGCTRASTS